jgi:putative Mg2+ transporter-C (MgtC) family protein
MDIITPEQLAIFIKLTIAVLLGSLIGIERTLAHRLAGFRTFALVSLGACAFTLVAQLMYESFGGAASMIDPLRMASQIIVGVGFLAGGIIFTTKQHVHGLTTGAGLWVAAAVGMAVGFGYYALATFVAILTLLIFGLFWQLEQKIIAREHEQQP